MTQYPTNHEGCVLSILAHCKAGRRGNEHALLAKNLGGFHFWIIS